MRELVIRRITDIRLDLLAKHQDVAPDTDIDDLHLCSDAELAASLTMWERTKHSSDLMIAAMQYRTKNIEDVIDIVIKSDNLDIKMRL